MYARRLLLLLALLALLSISSTTPPWRPLVDSERSQIEVALAARALPGAAGGLVVALDAGFLSPDGGTALLWLALQRPGGRALAGEPQPALALRAEDGWQILLPGEDGFDPAWQAVPAEMVPVELSAAPEAAAKSVEGELQAQLAPLTGFKLPYAKGTAYWMEGSVLHFLYDALGGTRGYPSCAEYYCGNAFDFTNPTGAIFPLLAARDGYLVDSYFSCADGSPNCTNFVLLADNTDGVNYFGPFQIYIHFSQYRAPTWLQPGDFVLQGQYIGFADDTGYSTSSHLHFMVTNYIEKYDPYPWGPSVPIRFDDVKANSGVPRSCYEAVYYPQYGSECMGDKKNPLAMTNDFFVSGNVGAFPPSAEMLHPSAGETVAAGSTSDLMDMSVIARDGVGVSAVQAMARWKGSWTAFGPRVTTPISVAGDTSTFDWDVHLCQAFPANGPLEVGVKVWDLEGNVVGPLAVRTVNVDHACPPASAQLAALNGNGESSAVRLDWTAADAGAGVAGFELQMRVAGGAWSVWSGSSSLTGAQRSAWLVTEPGKRYELRILARDANGQREPEPDAGSVEAAVQAISACSLDAGEGADPPVVLASDQAVEGNLCSRSGMLNDEDAYQFNAEAGRRYRVSLRSLNGGAAAGLAISLPDGATGPVLAAGPLGADSSLIFDAPQSGRYTLRVTASPGVFGTQARYSVTFGPGGMVYLPMTMR